MKRSDSGSAPSTQGTPAGEPLAHRAPAVVERVLVATDGSESAQAAVRLVSQLALPASAVVRIVSVTQPLLLTSPEWFRIAQDEWARGILHRAAETFRGAGIRVSSFARCGAPAEQILAEARETEAEMIVLGSHGRTGLESFLVGSVARNVAQHAEVPVLVARGTCRSLSRVVLAVDESPHSAAAMEFLARLPLPGEPSVAAVHVVPAYDPFPGLAPTDPAGFRHEVLAEQERRRAEGERLLTERLARVRGTGWHLEPVVVAGDPSAEILRVAGERDADLIVAGARGVSPLQRLLVGSVADRLLHTSPRALLLVR